MDKKLIKLIDKCPKFAHPELDRVETFEDLIYQCNLEMDLVEAGELKWTARQTKTFKTYMANVRISQLEAAAREAVGDNLK